MLNKILTNKRTETSRVCSYFFCYSVGSDDVVNGNIKLILGLVWSLIQRYQISGKKTKAPPKKLMTTWFQSILPELNISNFTSDWSDGIKLQ